MNSGTSASGPAGGLTPAQLASAYAYEPATGGAGQTVAIVDAFDDPQIEEDLGKFDTHYGLPGCTSANGCFEKVGQTGNTTSLPEADTSGWSVEISLDVETVHSVCPNCKILLVEANNESFKDLAAAVREAVSLGATEVSNSYAGPENGMRKAEQAAYNQPGVVIGAATGDDGYYDWDFINESEPGAEMPGAPASLPSVVAVGGTSLHLKADGTRASETVWNNNGPGDELGLADGFAEGASGGGCSTLFAAPPWQLGIAGFAATGCGGKRLDADVAAVADPNTGFDIYDTYNCGLECELFGIGTGKGWVTIGGTSLSTPLITALYGLAGGSHGLRYPAMTLYGHLADSSSLYDVTEGGNGFCDAEVEPQCGHPNSVYGVVDCEGTTACDAAPGFDGPSGVGAPRGLEAFEPLLPTAVITAPSLLKVGVASTFGAGASSDPYPGGALSSYSWSWGDGSADSSGVSPTHAYAKVGSYIVTLTVSDSYGLTSSASSVSVKVGTTSQQEEEQAKREKEARKEEEAAAAKRREQEQLTLSGAQGAAGFQVQLVQPVPDAQLASTVLQANSSGVVSIKVSCHAGESDCTGTVTLRTLAAVSASVGSAAKSKASVILTLAKGSFTVASGRTTTVKLHLSKRARALLARVHRLRARAIVSAHDPVGATHTTQAIVTLRAPRAKRGAP